MACMLKSKKVGDVLSFFVVMDGSNSTNVLGAFVSFDLAREIACVWSKDLPNSVFRVMNNQGFTLCSFKGGSHV